MNLIENYIKNIAKALHSLNENVYDIAKSLRVIAATSEDKEDKCEYKNLWKNVELCGLPKKGSYNLIVLKFLDQNDEIAYTVVSNIGETFIYHKNDQTYFLNRDRIISWKIIDFTS